MLYPELSGKNKKEYSTTVGRRGSTADRNFTQIENGPETEERPQ